MLIQASIRHCILPHRIVISILFHMHASTPTCCNSRPEKWRIRIILPIELRGREIAVAGPVTVFHHVLVRRTLQQDTIYTREAGSVMKLCLLRRVGHVRFERRLVAQGI